jgi:hypothetical protein
MRTLLTIACALVALACPAAASAVVGGTAVKPGSYPFVVTVGDTAAFTCGGTLIAPTAVLTAAHCLTDRRTAMAQLRVSDATRTLGVTAVVLHPKFDEASMHYDAALLILDQPLDGVPTLSMADSSPRAGTTVSAAGWGKTREGAARTPGELRSVILKVRPTSACSRGNTSFGPYFRSEHAVREQSRPRHVLGRQRRPARRHERRPRGPDRDHELRRRLRAPWSPRRLHTGLGHPRLGALATEARRCDDRPGRVGVARKAAVHDRGQTPTVHACERTGSDPQRAGLTPVLRTWHRPCRRPQPVWA